MSGVGATAIPREPNTDALFIKNGEALQASVGRACQPCACMCGWVGAHAHVCGALCLAVPGTLSCFCGKRKLYLR